jgi:hypothetical protein
MNKFIVSSILFFFAHITQAQFSRTSSRPALTSTTIKKINTDRFAVPIATSPELVRSLAWWRSINPLDLSLYTSSYNVASHTMGDTTYSRFAAKTSLSFRGWYHAPGVNFWHPDSLVNLLPLVNLRQIEIVPYMVNNNALEYLGRLPNLKSIYCNNTTSSCDPLGINADDNGFINLLSNRNLEYIWFKDFKRLTDVGFAAVTRMRNLKTLYISCPGTGLTDNAMLSLEGCVNLETLYLINSSITDAGLRNLLRIKKSLPALKTVYVNGSQTTEGGRTDFTGTWGTPIYIIF